MKLLSMAAVCMTAALFGVTACDSDDGPKSQTPIPDPSGGTAFSSTISAATGGWLKNTDTSVSLRVPPNALAADTTLTLKIEAGSGEALSSIYDFGPDGTTFQAPATLSVAFTGTPPYGKKAVLAWLDGSKWTALEGSTQADGKVTAPVSHFTRFTVIWVDGGVISLQAQCGENFPDFHPCGATSPNDLIGHWKIDDVCYLSPLPGDPSNPVSDFCPTATIERDMTFTADVDFSEQMMSMGGRTVTTHNVLTMPLSCFQDQTCSLTGKQCSVSGDSCVCTYDVVNDYSSREPDRYMYRIEGNELILIEGGNSQRRAPFCVRDGTLMMKQDTWGVVMVLNRR